LRLGSGSDPLPEIEIAGQKTRLAASSGLAIATAPARVGRPHFRIVRAGKTVIEKQSDWSIREGDDIIDALYVGGSSNRRYVQPGH
jgi:hypothetical protein